MCGKTSEVCSLVACQVDTSATTASLVHVYSHADDAEWVSVSCNTIYLVIMYTLKYIA